MPMSECSLEDTQLEVFALEHLEKALHAFINSIGDNNTFVLSHLDLRWPNIIVDDDLSIRAITDWEWAGSIPRQLFMPPSWITARGPQDVTGEEYRIEFSQFYKVLQANKGESDGHRLLAAEWDLQLPDRLELPITGLLQHHSQLLDIFYHTLYPRLFKAPRRTVVPEFFADSDNGRLASEVQRRYECSNRYTQYLKKNGLFVPDESARAVRELAEKMKDLEHMFGDVKERKSQR